MKQLNELIKVLNIEDAKKIKTIAENANYCISANQELENKEELLILVEEIVMAAKERIRVVAMDQLENNY